MQRTLRNHKELKFAAMNLLCMAFHILLEIHDQDKDLLSGQMDTWSALLPDEVGVAHDSFHYTITGYLRNGMSNHIIKKKQTIECTYTIVPTIQKQGRVG